MKTNTGKTIVEYIRAKQQIRVHDLVRFLGLSHVTVHKHLKRLVASGQLQKIGTPPLVFYTLAKHAETPKAIAKIPVAAERVIADTFLSITPDGKFLYGMAGFAYWANVYQPNKDIGLLASQYQRIVGGKRLVSRLGWIDATQKMTDTFKSSSVDRLFFADVYSYPIFGRTKLAKLVMHAKQSQGEALVSEIAQTVKPLIRRIVTRYRVDAAGYIPPTVPRPLQFMDVFAEKLDIPVPMVDLVKVNPGQIPIPQKTLLRLDERIINAQSSIYIRKAVEPSYSTILLIDDVAGSGASFQETGKKIRALYPKVTRVLAFAIVGNMKGYDVIRQM